MPSHKISEELWRYTDPNTGRIVEQYPIRWAREGADVSIRMDSNSWTPYPPAPGWERRTPTAWDPSTTPVDPDPPDVT